MNVNAPGPCRLAAAVLLALAAAASPTPARAALVWVEGEKPARATVQRHPWWYDQVKKDQFSGGDFLSHFSDKAPGEAVYRVAIPADGDYEFWVRANPVQSRLSYRVDGGQWVVIDQQRDTQGNTNVAADGKPDLRFLAWTRVGRLALKRGAASVGFRMDGRSSNHGYIDCFVLSTEPFTPDGPRKPGQAPDAIAAAAERGWFAFAPKTDRFSPASGIDLRGLNEARAGDGGPIGAKDGRFIHTKTGEPVRFWAVNGPPGGDREVLRREARVLAKRGVNLVRVHHGYFDPVTGAVRPGDLPHAADVVEAMKAEGIYTHFSVYFPLWLTPGPDTPWLKGYDGKQNPFAALFFNKEFQARYRDWWKALLLTPNPTTGKTLVGDPAVAGLEIINEDSYFFWTFDAAKIPDAQLKILETQYGDWLKSRYGSIDAALKRWDGPRLDRDRPAEGRVGFRPLWNMAHEKSARDRDAARFLAGSLRGFYQDTYQFLRGLGFKGVITASNWVTADPEVLGPLEKYAYTVTDFVDRHGYFGCRNQGPDSEWSVKDGHTYVDRSALRFDPEEPGKPKQFVHPAMDTEYDHKPSMISETTFNRPNRFRSEAPLYYAAYGALQGTDAVVHFALDGTTWGVRPGFHMQPWTVMTPAMMGQFPAAALIFRKGLVAEGDVLVDLNLRPEALFDLRGTPLPLDASFDELRLKDVPKGPALKPGNVIDPLVHYAGRTSVTFSDRDRAPAVNDLKRYVDRTRQTVTSTNGQLRLDFGKGVLFLNAPSAQGVSGALRQAGTADLKDLTVASGLDLGHVVVVSLDGRPLADSRKMLLQVMTEEKATGFRTEPAAGAGVKKILSVGTDPWLVKQAEGTVRLKRPDAASLKVTTLDENGEPLKSTTGAAEIRLAPTILYYLIEAAAGSDRR